MWARNRFANDLTESSVPSMLGLRAFIELRWIEAGPAAVDLAAFTPGLPRTRDITLGVWPWSVPPGLPFSRAVRAELPT